MLLGERPDEEIALGLVGKFWRPVIPYVSLTRDQFRDFAEPGYAKTVYALSVQKIDKRRTLLSGVMRTATTDEQARRRFRRYSEARRLSPETLRAAGEYGLEQILGA